MKQINTTRQTQIRSLIDNNSDAITDILIKISEDKWAELSRPQFTMKRLKRIGRRDSADILARYSDKLSKEKYLPSGLLTGTNDLENEIPANINIIVKEAIAGSNDIISSNFLHKGSKVARSVGRIIDKDTKEPLGTGFLISSNLLMTNNHVIPDELTAKDYSVQFDYVSDGTGNPISMNEFNFDPNKFFITSDQNDLDYSIIAVELKDSQRNQLSQYGSIKLIEETGKAHKGERLNIIHHPQGKPQQVSIRKNLLLSYDESVVNLLYMTDTEPGSSGSPVFNDEWELVALHYASIEVKNDRQKELFYQHMYKHYKPEEIKGPNNEVLVNAGIRISTIINNISYQRDYLNEEQKALLDEIFEDKKVLSGSRITRKNQVNPISNFDNLSTDYPFNININIGNRYLESTNKIPSNNSTRQEPNSIDMSKGNLELYNKKLDSQKNVFEALLFLEKARNSPYLPENSEIEGRISSYYGDIITNMNNSSLSKKELYKELNFLMESTLKLAARFPDSGVDLEGLFQSSNLESISLEGGVSYARARAHLYTWVDLQEDRMLKGVYTQIPIAPEQLLLKDLIQSLKLDIELPKRVRNNQFLNCEHIVPQSLFNKEKKGVSDLHHLITAEGATNTFRSNLPYRDLGQEGKLGPQSLAEYIDFGGKKSNGFFEPLNNKSLVARATLYFIIAHKNRLNRSAYDSNAIKTLIKWSKQSKPSKYELHRNEAIFEIQGNRNPLIDFPEWVDKVDFMEGINP